MVKNPDISNQMCHPVCWKRKRDSVFNNKFMVHRVPSRQGTGKGDLNKNDLFDIFSTYVLKQMTSICPEIAGNDQSESAFIQYILASMRSSLHDGW